MLASNIHRQRMIIEFLTEKNLYDTEIVEELFENFLLDLCGSLGMAPLTDVIIRTVPDGTSAYVMISESGIQIHSWFAEKFCSVDIYSCKPYSTSTVIDVINYYFEPTEIEIK